LVLAAASVCRSGGSIPKTKQFVILLSPPTSDDVRVAFFANAAERNVGVRGREKCAKQGRNRSGQITT
jgi:hypothetical protein